MSDRILISGLGVQAVVGIHAWERQAPRPLLLDLEVSYDLRAAGASDAITDTLDYQAIADLAAAVAGEKTYQLIEHYAECLCRRLCAAYPLSAVQLTVHKPGAVAAARTVSVRIRRRPADYSA